MKPNTAVIGLGVLGRPVAERLLEQGCAVAICDVRDEPVAALAKLGAAACASPAEVAARSDLIISLVATDAQTDEIVAGAGGVLETLRPDTVFVIGSTVAPEAARRTARAIEAKGGKALDAPISGGYLAARQGTLTFMVGGDPAALERALPVLQLLARGITHTGGIGTGQTAKLAHQLVFGLNVMALLEGLSLGIAGGVDPAAMKAVLKQGIANSGVLQLWHDLGPRWKGMLECASPGAPLPNLRKDLHLALDLARELGVDLPVAREGSRVADAGLAAGHADPRL